jgi:hypothetical protein
VALSRGVPARSCAFRPKPVDPHPQRPPATQLPGSTLCRSAAMPAGALAALDAMDWVLLAAVAVLTAVCWRWWRRGRRDAAAAGSDIPAPRSRTSPFAAAAKTDKASPTASAPSGAAGGMAGGAWSSPSKCVASISRPCPAFPMLTLPRNVSASQTERSRPGTGGASRSW